MPVEPNATDPASVVSPSEGQQSSVRRQNGSAPVHATETTDDAISVGEFTKGGRGEVPRESQPQGRDEREPKSQAPLGKEEELESRLGKALDRSEYLQDELDHQRGQVRYWRDMYRIVVRVIAEQSDDPALLWLDEITHDRFAHLLSERKL